MPSRHSSHHSSSSHSSSHHSSSHTHTSTPIHHSSTSSSSNSYDPTQPGYVASGASRSRGCLMPILVSVVIIVAIFGFAMYSIIHTASNAIGSSFSSASNSNA